MIKGDVLKNIMERLLKSKDLLIFLGVCGIFLIIVSSNFSSSKKTVQSNDDEWLSQYEQIVQQKLERILKSIDPTKNVSVMITFDDCYEYVLATETHKNTRNENQKGEREYKEEETEDKVVIIQNGSESKPFIVKKIYPRVRGVAIVSEGAKDRDVYLGLIKTTSTVLGITPDKVEVYVK